MFGSEKVIYDGDTELEHYQVVDMIYEGRKGRVLFTRRRSAAFSGIPLDGQPEMLFDYIQRLYELVTHLRPRRLLIIGGGAYTLPTAILKELPDIKIDVVEIDPGLDAIAEAYFDYSPSYRLNIVHAEGKQFLESTPEKYDMAIIDAFSHLHIPTSLTDQRTAELIHARLTKNGVTAMNIISTYLGREGDILRDLYERYSTIFPNVSIFPADRDLSLWRSQNFILVSDKKASHKDNHGLRFGALDPPL